MKRLLDIVASSFSLLILSPFLLGTAAIIKADSSGPVFYRGVRVGRSGTTFRMFKFRTMVSNAERMGGSSTADDDPRITRFGRFLRKYKIDELPQLINVFLGQMSIVGPRPEVPSYVDLFTEEERKILTVRPGLSDYASIWNCDEGAILKGSADPEKTYMERIRPEKLRLQLKYVQEQSLATDLRIICLTLKTLILKQRST